MQVERVQQWVMSTLLATTAVVFAGGLVALALYVDRPGALSGLLAIACLVVTAAVAACRLILGRGVLSGWLVLGLAPALLGWLLHR